MHDGNGTGTEINGNGGDTGLHEQGLLAEQAGRPEQALARYAEAVRAGDRPVESHFRMGLIQLDLGNGPRAERMFRLALERDPSFGPARRCLAELLEEQGLPGVAGKVGGGEAAVVPVAGGVSDPGVGEPSDDDCRRFLDLFIGRTELYARQWVDENGHAGYVPVREPASVRTVQAHLEGTETIGAYPLDDDGRTPWLAIDLDLTRRAIDEAGSEGGRREELMAQVHATAVALERAAGAIGVPLYIEESGWRGRHAWVFFSERVEAAKARRLARFLLRRVALPGTFMGVEVFPKQDRLEPGQIGNLIKLPLGIHRKTLRRCLFLDRTGVPFARQLAFLAGVERLSARALDQLLLRHSEMASMIERNREVRQAAAGSVAGPAATPGDDPVELLAAKCGVIRHLVTKAADEGHLTHDERLVILYTLGHVPQHGPALVHRVIASCHDYSQPFTQGHIDRLKANPVSCNRIRARIGEERFRGLCTGCEFQLPAGGYPTPLLHLFPQLTANMGRPRSGATDEQAARLLEVKRQIRNLEFELRGLEQRLCETLDEKGVDELDTASGRLIRAYRSGRPVLTIEL